MIFIAHNDIHGCLAAGYSPGRVRTRLRAQIHFSHTSYSLQISALTRTLNPLNPKFFSLQTTFSPHMPFTHLISISVQAHNDIHGCLAAGYSPGRVRTRLRAQIHFSHTSYSLQISALTRTLNPLNPKFSSLQTTFSPHMPFTHLISISVQALTPKLNPCPLPALISSLVTLATPTH